MEPEALIEAILFVAEEPISTNEFAEVLELCENGNEEIAYDMLWAGKAYDQEQAKAAQEAKEKYQAA